MPVPTSQQETVADIDSTNLGPQLDRQDVSGGGTREPDADSRTGKTSSHMGAERNTSTSSNLPSEDVSNAPLNQPGAASKDGRQSSQDGLLQIPPNGGAARRPTETSIWDWDTPLESVGESSSYYYEPQGELLQEQREQRPVRSEFSIPHAVSPSGVHWPFPTSAVSSSASEGFALPRRPPGVPSSVVGNKRKLTTDREGSAAGKQPDYKRSSRIMSDLGDDPSSPVDRPPAQSTRSQRGPGPGLRSGTDTTESRPRPSITDIEPGRAQAGVSGPRRTLTNPAIPMVLPARKVFPIQIGDKLFRLSGASISSDGKHDL